GAVEGLSRRVGTQARRGRRSAGRPAGAAGTHLDPGLHRSEVSDPGETVIRDPRPVTVREAKRQGLTPSFGFRPCLFASAPPENQRQETGDKRRTPLFFLPRL